MADRKRSSTLTETRWVRYGLTGIVFLFLTLFLVVPLVAVFSQAFAGGFDAFSAAIHDPDALAAVRLTLVAAAIAVPANILFGVTAAWAIAKFDFPGKALLTTLIDLPFAVSPVVSGLILVLLFGRRGYLGPWLSSHGLQVVFALPGIVLATVFVSFPFVAREVIPILEASGKDEEEAARVLGASGLQTFFRVTLPNIKWGVLYGAILCNARAMGEFGAVSVVSGHIRGATNTLPLHVEVLYNEYRVQAAFAVASMLACLAIATLILKAVVERRVHEAPRALAERTPELHLWASKSEA
jgi:sulfate/thiosulfate transport system permease protein